MKNIFLDFIAPDFWKTYVTIPDDLNNKVVLRECIKKDVEKSLNIAILLTKDYCLLPPAFVLQSDIVFTVCEEKEYFFEQGLILMPLKENSIDLYIEKKLREYEYVYNSHKGFYIENRWDFLYKNRLAIIKRNSSMGMTIAEKWSKGNEESEIWRPIEEGLPRYADELREAPTELQNRDVSVTLEAIIKYLEIPETDDAKYLINQAIQYEYGFGYLNEFDACIISNIPPKPYGINYLLPVASIYYNYFFVKKILQKLRILDYLENADPETIFYLRMESAFILLREKLFLYCNKVTDMTIALRKIFSCIENLGDLNNIYYDATLSLAERKELYREVVSRFERILSSYHSETRKDVDHSLSIDLMGKEVKNVSITINNSNIGQVNDFSNSTNPKAKSVMKAVSSNEIDYDSFKMSLIKMRDDNVFDEAQKKDIDEAIEAADQKNESKLISALKKVATFGRDILTQVSAEVFVSYMRSKGIIS